MDHQEDFLFLLPLLFEHRSSSPPSRDEIQGIKNKYDDLDKY